MESGFCIPTFLHLEKKQIKILQQLLVIQQDSGFNEKIDDF